MSWWHKWDSEIFVQQWHSTPASSGNLAQKHHGCAVNCQGRALATVAMQGSEFDQQGDRSDDTVGVTGTRWARRALVRKKPLKSQQCLRPVSGRARFLHCALIAWSATLRMGTGHRTLNACPWQPHQPSGSVGVCKLASVPAIGTPICHSAVPNQSSLTRH